ncbi:hypothetical protein [Nocardioides sp. TF02-7]|uniref:hypothetical protein n=1 Tax=Nocardioides sp. TF02-7 TaxID=2917724 RepID=UPI001F06FF08|nr:hypothetical protein [Nocardioides sp. TF02-7]UMG91313.1 hypothetical protein MF408_14190 [Nocardioides sp. TF02-7]
MLDARLGEVASYDVGRAGRVGRVGGVAARLVGLVGLVGGHRAAVASFIREPARA